MTAPLVQNDINLYLTGGTTNTDPNLSLGGNISAGSAEGTFHYEPFGIFRSNNFVTVPHSSTLNLNQMTVACWFRTSKNYHDDDAGYMIAKGEFADVVQADNFNFMMLVSCDVIDDNRLEFNWETLDGTEHYVFSTVAVNDGLWHLAVGTFDGTNTRLYLDGVLQETQNHAGQTPNNNTYPMYLGQYGPAFTTYDGDVDQVRLWNRALSQAEIDDLFANDTAPLSGLVYENTFGGSGGSGRIQSGVLHNLFRHINESELSSGVTIYRCVAVKNDNTTEPMLNPVLYLVSDTTSVDDLALYSFAQSDKNVVETPISDEFTPPTGSKINFIAALNRSGGLQLPDLAAGEFVNVWLRISVNPNSRPFPENAFKIRVECNSTGGSGPSTPPDNPDTGVNYSVATVADCGCNTRFDGILTRIKARNPALIIIDGDDAYSSGSQCFTDKFPEPWKSKTITSFGNHDVDESESQPSTKNQLLNHFGLPRTYYSKIINNLGIIIMESGENQSVSDAIGSAQYNFIQSELNSMKANSGIEWIFVFNHYPIYGPASDHGNNTGGRDRYDPLFDAAGVDAVFTGHNHNMWSSKLLKYNSGSPSNPTATGTDPNYSYNRATANHGKLYFGVGAGGRSHYGIDSTPSYVVFTNDDDYGYLFIEFSNNGKVATFKFYQSNDTLLKTVTLTHL